MEKKPKTLKTINFGFKPGESISLLIKIRISKGWKEIERDYTVVTETESFLTLDNGSYKETYNKKEIALGQIIIERMDENLKNNVRFNKEELLDLCRKNGTTGRGVLKTFEELGEKASNIKQVENYIYRWGIRQILTAESKKNEEVSKDESADQNIQTETGPVKEYEQSTPEDKPATETVQEVPKASEEEIKGFSKAAIELDFEKPKGALRVSALEGEHFYFDLEPAALEISNKEMKAFPPIKYGEELNSLIDNLVEIRDNYINA